MSDGNSDLNWVFEIFPNEIAVLTVPFCMVSDFKVTNSSLICRWISDNWHRSGYECVFWRHIRVFFSFLCSSLNVPIWGPKLSIWKVKSPSPGVGLGGKAAPWSSVPGTPAADRHSLLPSEVASWCPRKPCYLASTKVCLFDVWSLQ